MVRLGNIPNIWNFYNLNNAIVLIKNHGIWIAVSAAYSPGKSAFLFSRKADVPSLKSAVPKE